MIPRALCISELRDYWVHDRTTNRETMESAKTGDPDAEHMADNHGTARDHTVLAHVAMRVRTRTDHAAGTYTIGQIWRLLVHVPLRLPDHADGVGTQDMAPVRIGGRRGDVDVVHGHGTQSLYGQSGFVDGQGLRIVQEHGSVRLFRHDTSRHTQSPISVGFSMVRPP
ncbi:hypothetical protein B5783_0585 [Bifidobacterium breve]|nr:hypothetical protein B5783_0585 [Bifidobacterium breve]